jgi:peptidoglycan/xylan/chitin deacetylase (PgdA/CDA1 family)
MRIPGVGRLKRRVRWFLNSATRPPVILLYHRVAELQTDPQLLAVTPKRFAEHLDVLRRRLRPISLADAARSIEARTIPRDAVVVTFDDGYADNLMEASPRLEAKEIAATFFVTSGQIGRVDEFWWDELERLILMTESLPSRLELAVDDLAVSFAFQTGCEFPKAHQLLLADWNVLQPNDPTERHALYRRMHNVMKGLSPAIRDRVLAHLRDWARDSGSGRPSHRALTQTQLKTLGSVKLAEVGAHTVHHPALSALAPGDQAFEIEQSKAGIEEMTGRPVASFSYPFGGRQDYTMATVSMVKAAGFQSACSNFPGWVGRNSDPFQLPRFLVRNWTGEEFARRLTQLRFV